MNYQIHNLLSFKVDWALDWPNLFTGRRDIELEGFTPATDTAPDFTAVLGDFTPHPPDSFVLDNRFYVADDYFYVEDSLGRARWRLEISGFERGDTWLQIQANPWGKRLVTELLLYPVIWLKLNQRGFPVIHASGVTDGNRAFIFAGQGAAGKSSIALDLVAGGFKLLGDHFVILGKNEARSFLSPLHVMDFNLSPIVRDNMKPEHQRAFRRRQWLRRLTGRRLATKIGPRDILPEAIAARGRPRAIYLVLPRREFRVAAISRETMVRHLVHNQQLEQARFTEYMLEYACLFPASRLAGYWDAYRDNLTRALTPETDTYLMEVPQRLDRQTLDSIRKMIIA